MIIQTLEDIKGLNVTIMGLGLHGGGLAAARFFATNGAKVTVTDLKNKDDLVKPISALSDLNINYTLSCHKEEDFLNADLVIKNPAVRINNPYLKLARWIETDISIFLSLCTSRIVAISGSKGKSTCAAALSHILSFSGIKNYLGGNITISPLSFLSELLPNDVVVLELSSWQLGDLKNKKILKPEVAILTRIVPDHQDRYENMNAYVADKRLIYADQDQNCYTVCDFDDPYGLSFAKETKAKVLAYAKSLPSGLFGIELTESGLSCPARLPGLNLKDFIPADLSIVGEHARRNLAAAALAAWALGAEPEAISRAASSFKGIEHRIEFVKEYNGIKWYNDSAATVPEAMIAAMNSFNEPIVLITGGNDKALDFSVALEAYKKAEKLILLKGSGTDKIIKLLNSIEKAYEGPFDNMPVAVKTAAMLSRPGYIVVLSPGCTSFGLFANEFERGSSFKTAVQALPNQY